MKKNAKIEYKQKAKSITNQLDANIKSTVDLMKKIRKDEIDDNTAGKLMNALNKESIRLFNEAKSLIKQKKDAGN